MKSTRTLRFSLQRLFLLTLVSFVAVAAVLGIAASANKANRAAKARAEQAANTKSGIDPALQNDKHPLAPLSPVVGVTLTDNVSAATKVAPGAVINYTAVVSNTGAASPADDASNVTFTDMLDGNTTLQPNSVHASPIAFNDTYNWVGNTLLDTNARALPAVTANDVAVNAPLVTDTFAVTAIAGGPTALGGTVTVASPSGAFTYTPPLGRPNLADGATVQDSFTYTITNTADASLTSTGTVRINLTGRVWYLQAGAAGDGRSNTPSSSPAAMSTAADKSTDLFYIFSNASSLNGPFTVDAGQQLLGSGVNLVVSAITLFNSAAPTPTTTNTAGSCVSLGGAPGNNTLSGFNIGNCTGGTAIVGGNVGTLNVNTLSINTNGGGLDLTGSGNPVVNVVLGGLTSTGGANNVKLATLGGTVSLANGTLSGATGNAFDVNGGVATITYLGNITNSTLKQVNIANTTGGSATFDGAVNGTGTGINLATNTGNTITFRGGVVLSTSTNNALSATGGGTINVCDENPCNPAATGSLVNTLTTTTGTALNVNATTIGANKLEFRSITANGSSANNGITLDNAGTGGLTVAGNGGTCTSAATCTGGTISNKTGGDSNTQGTGIYVNNTSNVSITRMKLNDFSNYAVRGTNATNFTMNNCFIDGVNGSNAGADEGTIIFDGLFGTGSFSSDTIKGGIEDNFRVANISGTLTLTIDSCTIRDSSTTSSGNDNVNLRTNVNANINAHITNSTFAATNADHIQTIASDQSTLTIVATGNGFSGGGGGSALGQGITISGGNATPTDSTEVVRFNISNNNMSGTIQGGAININQGSGNGNWQGQVNGNTIGNAAVSCSGASQSSGVRLENHSKGVLTGIISNNIIHQTCGAGGGISLTAGDTTASGLGNGPLNATVTGNTIDTPGGSADHGVVLVGGAGVTNNSNQICLDLLNNSSTGSPVIGSSGFAYRIRQRFAQTVFLPGYGGANNSNAAVQTYFQGRPNTAIAGDGGTYSITNTVGIAPPNGPGGGFVNTPGGAPCTQPTVPTVVHTGDTTASRGDTVSNTSSAAAAIAQPQTATAPVAVQSVKPASPKVGNSSVLAKATTPKATPAEIARIYRSEATLSHHALRRNFKYASDNPNAPASGETVTLNTITTLPAGKSVTVKFGAMVNFPPTARQVETHVTVTGGNFPNATSSDPGPPVVANTTITLIDTLVTWNGSSDTNWNNQANWTQPAGGTQYAPGISNPAINDVVIPNVGAQPTIGTTDITVFSLSLANGRTLTITNPRVLTIGGAPGGDLTLDGIISGGNLNLGTGTHVINNAGGTGSLSTNNIMTVLSGSTTTLNNNLQAGAVAVNGGGSLNITNRTLSLNGPGAALAVGGGGTFTTTGSTAIFNGTVAQQAAGTIYNNLTINNTVGAHLTGVTLTGNATVNGVLTLTSSDLDTGANTLTMPAAASSAPASGASDVVGNVKRTGFVSGGAALSFGNPLNTIRINVGTAPTDINVLLAKNAPTTYSTAVLRSYTITPTGGSGITATVRLHYRQVDLNGNLETPAVNFNLRRKNTVTGQWQAVVPTSRNTGVAEDNWLESNAVTGFSEWTFASLAPTAAGGVVTGRIVDDHGNAVEGAVVRLSGAQNRKFITDANGVYRFENVAANGFYTVTPARANYTFSPAVRSFSQIGETTEAGFGATLLSSGFVNPLDTPEYFVRQHYLDFLGREPDEAGFNFWSDQILECGGDSDCVQRRRENVSAAYFLSIEFQQTGGLVDGLYRASYGVSPQYAAFMPDTRTVGAGVRVGNEGWETTLRNNKEAFVNAFVNRAEFHQLYDGMNDSLFIDTLLSHTGVSFTAAERDELIGSLGTGQMTRAEALRSIAENGRFVDAKRNQMFVMMEYMGYLRRDPDASGYAFWLNKLNQFNGNFEQAEMVKAFIVSGEFRERFPR